MTTLFMDTSALVKRYVTENGSIRIMAQTQPETESIVLISELTTVEMCSAFARRQRLKQIPEKEAKQRRIDFLSDVDNAYLVFPIDTLVLQRALRLVDRYPLRTLDAVQLASAIEATIGLNEPLMFISADNDLIVAAAGEGLPADNPLNHL